MIKTLIAAIVATTIPFYLWGATMVSSTSGDANTAMGAARYCYALDTYEEGSPNTAITYTDWAVGSPSEFMAVAPAEDTNFTWTSATSDNTFLSMRLSDGRLFETKGDSSIKIRCVR